MNIVNTEFFGYIMANKKYKNINEAMKDFSEFKIHALGIQESSHYYVVPLDMSVYSQRSCSCLLSVYATEPTTHKKCCSWTGCGRLPNSALPPHFSTTTKVCY